MTAKRVMLAVVACVTLTACTRSDIRSAGEVTIEGCRVVLARDPGRADRVAEVCRRVLMAEVLVRS